MNEIYQFVIGDTVDPLQIIFKIVIFMMVFESVMSIINMLTKMATGGKR